MSYILSLHLYLKNLYTSIYLYTVYNISMEFRSPVWPKRLVTFFHQDFGSLNLWTKYIYIYGCKFRPIFVRPNQGSYCQPKQCTIIREIAQNDHTFALGWSLPNGWRKEWPLQNPPKNPLKNQRIFLFQGNFLWFHFHLHWHSICIIGHLAGNPSLSWKLEIASHSTWQTLGITSSFSTHWLFLK